jgi:predicted transcriptional regulator
MSNARARIHKAAKSQYAAIPNAIAQSRTLSPNARAVLVELLSRPDDWEARADQLAYEHLSIRTVYRVLTELIAAGYVVRSAIKGEDGRWKYWRYDVFDAPVDPVAKNDEVVESKKADVSKRKSETMRATTRFVDDGTHTKTEKEERETNAPADDDDGIPDYVPPASRSAMESTPQPDGGAKVYTLIEAYCDAWDVAIQKYRDQWHRSEKRGAEKLANLGAMPDEVRAMIAERRAKGKQPDECPMAYLANDYVGWKSRQKPVALTVLVMTDEQRAAREKQMEAEREAYRIREGLA